MILNKTTIERFWKYVLQTETCWLWAGYKDKDGYGSIRTSSEDSTRMGAHRFSYWLHKGDIDNLHVLHKCDVPACVNPDHLFLGTAKDNVLDMFDKKRENKARGFQLPQTKLNPDQVQEIRFSYKYRIITMSMLAKKYGVSKGTIQRIIERKSFKYV